jgi:hypothetical protein
MISRLIEIVFHAIPTANLRDSSGFADAGDSISMSPSPTITQAPAIQVDTTSPSRFGVRASRMLGRPSSIP